MKSLAIYLVTVLTVLTLSSFQTDASSSNFPPEDPGTSVIVPLDQTFFITCANEGAGEYVRFTGGFHIVYFSKENAAGGRTVYGHYQPQNAVGIGLTTGNEYRGTGSRKFSFTTNGTTQSFVDVNNFNLIGKGGVGSQLLQVRVNFVVNANGDVTVQSFTVKEQECS